MWFKCLKSRISEHFLRLRLRKKAVEYAVISLIAIVAVVAVVGIISFSMQNTNPPSLTGFQTGAYGDDDDDDDDDDDGDDDDEDKFCRCFMECKDETGTGIKFSFSTLPGPLEDAQELCRKKAKDTLKGGRCNDIIAEITRCADSENELGVEFVEFYS